MDGTNMKTALIQPVRDELDIHTGIYAPGTKS